MCPACLAAATLLAAKAASIGGGAALAAKALHATLRAKTALETPETEGEKHEPTPDRLG